MLASCKMYCKCMLNFSSTKSVSKLILAVEVRCHKLQGMMEASMDMMCSCPKTSDSVRSIITAFLERDSR